MNCPIHEQTADGVCVGRCWFYLQQENGRYSCPRHGDVTEAVKRFEETGGCLTLERDHKKGWQL